MFILFHVAVAIASLIYTAVTYFAPSKAKLLISYMLVGITMLSGTYLVVVKPTHMVQSCIEGLIYLAFVSFGIVSVRNKLLTATQKTIEK